MCSGSILCWASTSADGGPVGRRRQTIEDVLGNVKKTDTCWYWLGHRNTYSYGVTGYNGIAQMAHRVIYELYKGAIPEGMMLLHSCDVPFCVNPEHLHPGTCAENSKEASQRGRWNPGMRWTKEKTKKFLAPFLEELEAKRASPIPGLPYKIAKNIKVTPSCWLWVGYKSPKGYGIIGGSREKGATRAHRHIYEVFKGKIPEGLVIRHTCDTPACVNPEHLIVGTQADNVKDCQTRGRVVFGERHHNSKLSNWHAWIIKYLILSGKASLKELAEESGVTVACLSSMAKEKTWKEIPFTGSRKRLKINKGNISHRINATVAKEIKEALRSGGKSQYKIAKEFGVSQAEVSNINTGKAWSKV